jgi:hypothetical protein
MVELFGKIYPWSREAIKEQLTDRLLSGDELTICSKDKTAWVNKWHKNPQEINYDLAMSFVVFGLVGVDSGNFDTGEVHYTFLAR